MRDNRKIGFLIDILWAWGSVVVKALHYRSEGPGIAGAFSVASDSSMCPGVDSASKNE